jgi:hypothetical protein
MGVTTEVTDVLHDKQVLKKGKKKGYCPQLLLRVLIRRIVQILRKYLLTRASECA